MFLDRCFITRDTADRYSRQIGRWLSEATADVEELLFGRELLALPVTHDLDPEIRGSLGYRAHSGAAHQQAACIASSAQSMARMLAAMPQRVLPDPDLPDARWGDDTTPRSWVDAVDAYRRLLDVCTAGALNSRRVGIGEVLAGGLVPVEWGVRGRRPAFVLEVLAGRSSESFLWEVVHAWAPRVSRMVAARMDGTDYTGSLYVSDTEKDPFWKTVGCILEPNGQALPELPADADAELVWLREAVADFTDSPAVP